MKKKNKQEFTLILLEEHEIIKSLILLLIKQLRREEYRNLKKILKLLIRFKNFHFEKEDMLFNSFLPDSFDNIAKPIAELIKKDHEKFDKPLRNCVKLSTMIGEERDAVIAMRRELKELMNTFDNHKFIEETVIYHIIEKVPLCEDKIKIIIKTNEKRKYKNLLSEAKNLINS